VEDDRNAQRRLKTYRIAKTTRDKQWDDRLRNFRKNWLHLKNFLNSVLKTTTLCELPAMAKQVSGFQLLPIS
jgi:hypothetical protein